MLIMLRDDLIKIFEKIQDNRSNHTKYLKVITDLYKNESLDIFINEFMSLVESTFHQPIDKNPFVMNIVNFSSKFCSNVTLQEEETNDAHPFLSAVIHRTLRYHNLSLVEARYHSCRFIMQILQNIGDQVQLENDLCDEIQQAMLERIQDGKVAIRLQAISALVRLQDPHNMECPVIKAYLNVLSDVNHNVRREVVIRIAPNIQTLSKIKDRIRDVDQSVRLAAFQRCADIGPTHFKIIDRLMILKCGFNESVQVVKNYFLNNLLPKWLTVYEGNYLNFIKALKLTADEHDLTQMTKLSQLLIGDFYLNHPVNNLIAILPLTDEKVIRIEDISNHTVLFWNILVKLLRESNDMEIYLNEILPSLVSFCSYIDKVIQVKSKEKMDEWKYLAYQFDLWNLFEILKSYDFSDEGGRRATYTLITSLLENYEFSTKVYKTLVSIAHQCSSSIELFTDDMCKIISEIREPLCEQDVEIDTADRNFELAKLNVNINVLREEIDGAVLNRDFLKAQLCNDKIAACQEQIEKMQQPLVQKVRILKSDNVTICRCLDVLTAVLELPEVDRLTGSLLSCKDNFLVPLIENHAAEAHWRILKCMSLFAIIDGDVAKVFAKVICIPIATYRSIPNYNLAALVQSIVGISDLLRIYGPGLICDDNLSGSTSTSTVSTRRRLYNQEDEETLAEKEDNLSFVFIFEIFLDMLDDETEDIRHAAITAISKLITAGFPATSSVISRLILKWYNPLTGKEDETLQQRLGILIEFYTKMKNSADILKGAIFCVFSSIANAPKTSPLADIDVDNVVLFFSAIIKVHSENVMYRNDPKILLIDILIQISEHSNEKIVHLLAKFLLFLDIPKDNVESLNELVTRTEDLLDQVKDRHARRNIEKFLSNLKQRQAQLMLLNSNITEDQDSSRTGLPVLESTRNSRDSKELQNKSVQVKRKKRRSKIDQKCMVILERVALQDLQTIMETSAEAMQIADDDSKLIETPSTNSDNTRDTDELSKRVDRIVLSETSDSDRVEKENTRRSKRIRRKRCV